MKLRKPICPYCGKKVNIFRTWSLKLQGEYRCIHCKGISNIVLDPGVSILAAIAIILSIGIFLFYRFIFQEITLHCILFMAIPYLLFFIFSLFLVRLKRPIVRSQTGTIPKIPERRNPPPSNHQRSPYPSEGLSRDAKSRNYNRKL